MRKKGMEKDREKFLKYLLHKKQEIQQSLLRLKEKQKEENDRLSQNGLMDESDLAQKEILSCGTYHLIEKKAKELKDIEKVIQRITGDETFGLCEECGKLIPAERLLIVPEATLCVSCQRRLEKFDQMRRPIRGASSLFERNKNGGWNSPVHPLEDEVEFLDLDFLPLSEADKAATKGHPSGR